MKNVMPYSRTGAIIAKAKAMFPNNVQLQPADLRFEKVLTATSVGQKFSFTGAGMSSATQRPTEIFLSTTDLAIIYALRVSVQRHDTTFDGNSGNSQDYTYPDKAIFPAAAVGTSVSEADALMAIWNGNISIKAGPIEVLNNLQLSRFYRANQTQDSATTQAQLNNEGFVDIDIPLIISGQDSTILDFVPAQGADVAQIGGAAGFENNVAFHFQVILIRNGAQPATWTQMKQLIDKTGRQMI